TSAARVKVLRAAPPAVLEDTHAALAGVERELTAYARDQKAGLSIDEEAQKAAKAKEVELKARAEELDARTKSQRAIVDKIDAIRKEIEAGQEGKRTELRAEIDKLKAIKPEQLLVHADVDEGLVAGIVADWTGIPVGKMVKDDIEGILKTEERLR